MSYYVYNRVHNTVKNPVRHMVNHVQHPVHNPLLLTSRPVLPPDSGFVPKGMPQGHEKVTEAGTEHDLVFHSDLQSDQDVQDVQVGALAL